MKFTFNSNGVNYCQYQNAVSNLSIKLEKS